MATVPVGTSDTSANLGVVGVLAAEQFYVLVDELVTLLHDGDVPAGAPAVGLVSVDCLVQDSHVLHVDSAPVQVKGGGCADAFFA